METQRAPQSMNRACDRSDSFRAGTKDARMLVLVVEGRGRARGQVRSCRGRGPAFLDRDALESDSTSKRRLLAISLDPRVPAGGIVG